MLELFVASYKDTYYAALAGLRIEELKTQRVALATPPKHGAESEIALPSAPFDLPGPPTSAQILAPTKQVPDAMISPLVGCIVVIVGNEQRCIGQGQSFKDCADCPEMVVVPPGRFSMGSPSTEQGRFDDEGPLHDVTIAKPLAVGRFPITRGEYAKFVREDDRLVAGCWTLENSKRENRLERSFRTPGFAQDDRHPAVCVSWSDANAYTEWLSYKTNKTYRLLSEAEREYVTRAGTTTRYFFGNDEASLCRYGNVGDQTAKKSIKGMQNSTLAVCDDGYAYTAPVGHYAANAFGIHDVHGNVSEWTEDCWYDFYHGAPTDGSAWRANSDRCYMRVFRGGSWSDQLPRMFRSAVRNRNSTDYRGDHVGFRVVRTLNP